MDLTYVPSYIIHIERQNDGWPVGVSDLQKLEAIEIMRSILDEHPNGLELYYLVQIAKHRIPVLKKVVLIDFEYAVVHRALLALDGIETVYRISEQQRKQEEYIRQEKEKEAKKEVRRQKKLLKQAMLELQKTSQE